MEKSDYLKYEDKGLFMQVAREAQDKLDAETDKNSLIFKMAAGVGILGGIAGMLLYHYLSKESQCVEVSNT